MLVAARISRLRSLSPKLQVVEILASLRRAGAETVAVSLARGLDRSRFECAVVSLYDAFADGFEPVLADSGVTVMHLGKRRGFDPRIYPRLARILRELRPDVIHTHSYVLRYAWPARLAAGVGTIVHTVHNVADREVDVAGRMLHRLAFRRGVIPVAVSQAVARSFRDVYGFDPAATIPNGIDTGRYRLSSTREEWRQENGFRREDLLVASVARLDPQKNPLGLIEAFGRALGGDPRCHLLLAGDGSLREQARAHVERLGLSARVHFLGVRDDIPALLAACDLFALASHWEGNPISVMEAEAAGLPVIATAVGGVPELVTDGVTGLLVAAGDGGALAGALGLLARDEERRQRIADAARAASARFDVAAMLSAYAALFESAAGVRA
jgi:glycosyltransferase involved in cell wall biosynthesis